MHAIFTTIVLILFSYVVIKMYNTRNFKLMRKQVWLHPIYELKRYVWFASKMLVLVFIVLWITDKRF